MALVNISACQEKVIRALAKAREGEGLEVLSYKRNRGLSIIKLGAGLFQVRERGYNEDEWEVDLEALPRLLKTIAKREFPRSRKVRVYRINGPQEVNRPMKRL